MQQNAAVTVSKRVLTTVVQRKQNLRKQLQTYQHSPPPKKCVQNGDFYKRCLFVLNGEKELYERSKIHFTAILYCINDLTV